jgi:D-lactate dehydrogenase
VYRVREGNFNLRGLLGFDLNGRTVGVIGTGKIGEVFCRICKGFGMTVLAYDPYPNPALKGEVEYVSLDRIYAESDVISLHCPLLKDNEHMLNKAAFAKMKPGVLIINTSRGALIDTKDVIPFLKNGRIGMMIQSLSTFFSISSLKIESHLCVACGSIPSILPGGLGLDVYENESALFFEDQSIKQTQVNPMLQDDLFERLLSFPNVIITGHQAFFTSNALTNIAGTDSTDFLFNGYMKYP